MSDAKMRYCWNCGAEMGVFKRGDWLPQDTCGAIECERAARDSECMEREDAHHNLDADRGWL